MEVAKQKEFDLNRISINSLLLRDEERTTMLPHTLAVLAYLGLASSRETIRPMPTITNSLVNLGKMEISFYFNGNGRDSPSRIPDHGPPPPPPSPYFFPKNEPIMEEPCLCSSLRNVKDTFLTNPTGLLNKILMNNDLFSFNKDPISSTLCCESHEHVQEGTVVFEFPPNQKPLKPIARSNPLPMMPFLFDSVIPNKSMLPPLKTKAIEIFLFPKKKDMGSFDLSKFQPKKKDTIPKEGITIVGDKKLDNINLFKPVLPVVKKDLNVQEKIEKEKEKEKEKEIQTQLQKDKENETEKPVDDADKMIVEPASKPNAV